MNPILQVDIGREKKNWPLSIPFNQYKKNNEKHFANRHSKAKRVQLKQNYEISMNIILAVGTCLCILTYKYHYISILFK